MVPSALVDRVVDDAVAVALGKHGGAVLHSENLIAPKRPSLEEVLGQHVLVNDVVHMAHSLGAHVLLHDARAFTDVADVAHRFVVLPIGQEGQESVPHVRGYHFVYACILGDVTNRPLLRADLAESHVERKSSS